MSFYVKLLDFHAIGTIGAHDRRMKIDLCDINISRWL